jgi:hypothetical protein
MIETLTNIGVGFILALVSQIVIFHFYDVQMSLWDNIEITLWFTVVSIVRGYTLRRIFNSLKVA